MKAGKPSQAVLSRSVIKQLKKDQNAPCPRGKQLDYGSFSLDQNRVVLSAQALARPTLVPPRLGLISAVNNILCSGAKPGGIMLTILFPTTAPEQELRAIIRELDGACQELGIPVLGGHTEILSGLQEPLITVTAAGAVEEKKMVLSNGAGPGMDLVMTKYAGLTGTALLARQREQELLTRYTAPFLDKAKQFDRNVSIAAEAAIALEHGACAMHDVSLGGIYGCLWELAESGGVGLNVDLKAIPIKQETVEISEFFDLNPYKLYGAGALLIATLDGEGLVDKLAAEGIPAAVIGHTTEGNDRILMTGEERRFLENTQSDALYQL